MQVQHIMLNNSYMQPGVPKFDYMRLLQLASDELNWSAMLTPLNLT